MIGGSGSDTLQSPLRLIHMNGRVYDPQIGRFLSADPYIQSPYNTQSYNRYSYTINKCHALNDVALSIGNGVY
jgi:RHS repeat-associated protein